MVTEYKKVVRTELYDYQKGKFDITHLIMFICGILVYLWIKSIIFSETLFFILYGLILCLIVLLVSIKKRVVTFVKVR